MHTILDPTEDFLPQVGEVTLTYRSKPTIPIGDRVKLNSSYLTATFLYDELLPRMGDLETHEEFYVLLLNSQLQPSILVNAGIGALTATVVDIKKLCRLFAILPANQVVLCHNHPSGVVSPSRQDNALTEKIKELAQLHDNVVVDHIILAPERGRYYSYADENAL